MNRRIITTLISALLVFSVLTTNTTYAYSSVATGQMQTVTIDGEVFTLVATNTTLTSTTTINNDLIIAKDVTLTTSVGSSLTVNGNVYVYGYISHYGTIKITGELKVHNFKNFATSGSGSPYGTFLGTGSGNIGSIVALNKQYIPIPLELLSYSSTTKALSGASLPVGTVKINDTTVDTDANGVFNYNLGDPIDITVSIIDVFGFSNSYSFSADYIRSLDSNAQPINVTGVTLNKSSFTLTGLGSTEQLISTISPSNATNKNVTWTSSDEAVASVSSTGVVTAVRDGNATITVKTVDGNYQTSTEVNVSTTTTTTKHLTFNVVGLGGVLKALSSETPNGFLTDSDIKIGYLLIIRAEPNPLYRVYKWTVNGIESINTNLDYKVDKVGTDYIFIVEFGLKGDLNLDDSVTLTDLVKLRRNLAGLENLENKGSFNADLNQDNELTLTDLVKLRRMLAGLE